MYLVLCWLPVSADASVRKCHGQLRHRLSHLVVMRFEPLSTNRHAPDRAPQLLHRPVNIVHSPIELMSRHHNLQSRETKFASYFFAVRSEEHTSELQSRFDLV